MIKCKCQFCSKEYEVCLARKDKTKFCSKSCLGKSTKGNKFSKEALIKHRKSVLWKHIEEAKKLYSEGKSTTEIGKIFNCNKNTVKTIFRRIGVEMRKGGNKKGFTPWNKGKPYTAIQGERNPNWKGGITPLNQQVRHCLKYKEWIKAIFERDNYTCVLCGKRGSGDLEADHHPKYFCQIMFDNKIKTLEDAEKCSEMWDINNGRTLCMKCHKRGNIKPVKSRFKRVNNKM